MNRLQEVLHKVQEQVKGPKLTEQRAKLRDAVKDNATERCSFCRFFEGPDGCSIVERAGADLVCNWIQSRETKAGKYNVSDADWEPFVKGMVKLQPYQHIVVDGANTPEGQMVLIKDTMKPKPHFFSLTRDFHIEHTSLEHHWTQAEVDKLIQKGK